MFPVPSSAHGGTNLVSGDTSQIGIAAPALQGCGERIDIARLIERRRGAKIHRETRLRGRCRQQNGGSGRKIREDLVAEAEAMVENRSIFGGHAEVVALRQFNHPVGRFGAVKHQLQGRRDTRLKTCETLRVLRYRACAKVKFGADTTSADGRNDVFEAAPWTKRLAEPIQAQRSAPIWYGREVR